MTIFADTMTITDLNIPPDSGYFFAGTGITVRQTAERPARTGNFCILTVERGSASFEIDFRRHELQENGVLLLGVEQFVRFIEVDKDFRISCVMFTVETWRRKAKQFGAHVFSFLKQYPYVPPSGESRNGIYYMMQAAEKIYLDTKHSFRIEIFENIVQNMLFDIYDRIQTKLMKRDSSNTSRREAIFENFIHLVAENCALHRDVGFYADKLCITTRYLSSIVRNMINTSPKEVIDTRCIQEIKMLLCDTGESIQEISSRLHFSDQSYFARYFRRNAGTSPEEYRKNCNK